MEEGTNWLPGIVVLSIGLLSGIVLAWWLAKGNPVEKKGGRKGAKGAKATKGSKPAAAVVHGEVTDLDLTVRRDALVRQLRELDDTGSKLDPDELARQRYALELAAAEILRSLDHVAEASPAPAAGSAAEAATGGSGAPAGGWLRAHPGVIGIVAGITGAGFVILLQQLITENSTDRAGGTMTGNANPGGGRPMGGPPGGPMGGPANEAPDPELDELRAAVAAHPESIDAMLDLAQLLVFKDKLMEAFQVSQAVLAKEPENPRATIYMAVVRLAMGQGQAALDMSARAVAKDPQLVEGWFHRGLIAYELERWDLAVEAWERAIALRPDGAEAVAELLGDARSRAKGGPGTRPAMGNPGMEAPGPGAGMAPGGALPSGHPPVEGSPAPTPPAAMGRPGGAVAMGSPADGTGVTGTITLTPGIVVPPGAVLFLYARPDGVRTGPPSAVKRIEAPSFPMPFSLGPEDSMIAGLPWPEKAMIDARIDADGIGPTRDPSDPVAEAQGLAPGVRGLSLVLRAP